MINKTWTPEVQSLVIGGADSGSEPELIGSSTAAHLRNVSVRGGRAHSRPRFKKILSLADGKIQGAAAFNDRGLLMTSIDGRVYEVDPLALSVVEKTDASTRGSPNRARHFYCETVGTLIIQDFQAKPLIYDGSTFRQAESDEVPVGGPMGFSNGRLAVAVNTGRDVRLGDIRDGGVHQSELKFTETYFLTGGGDFSFPSKVTSIRSLPVIDTSTGQGSLIVGCRERVFSLKTQLTSRDMWADVAFQTEFLPVGITGPTAVTGVNQDLYFRAPDGVRSIRAAVSDLSSPGLTPLSNEMAHRFDHDTDFLLEYASVVLFDNRLFVTHSPMNYGNRAINLGLAVYNFDTISKSGQKSAPVWDGEWDGVQIAEVVVGDFRGSKRMFIVGRDSEGNGVWEVYAEAKQPIVEETPAQELVTRTFVGGGINDYKALRRCDVWLSGIEADVNLKVYFRSDKYPYWILWDEFDVATTSPDSWAIKNPVHRNPLSTRSAPDDVDGRTNQLLSQGFTFQIRLVWSGVARVDMIQVWTESVGQSGLSDNVENQDESLYEVPAGHVRQEFWYPHATDPNP